MKQETYAFVVVSGEPGTIALAKWLISDGRSGSQPIATYGEIRRLMHSLGVKVIDIRRDTT
jgi:hypothetical protein